MGKVIQLKRKISTGSILLLAAAIILAAAFAFANRASIVDGFSSSSSAEAMSLDSSVTYKFKKFDGGLAVCGSDLLATVQPSGGAGWTVALNSKNYMIAAEGNYVLAFETGGRKISLFSDGKEVFRIETENDIITANVSRSGVVAVATKEKGFRSQVLVYKPSGEQIYEWHSVNYYVVDIAVTSSAMAVAGLNSDDASSMSYILLFSFNSSDYKTVNGGNDNLVGTIKYIDDGVLAVGDRECTYIKKNGEIAWSISYGGRTLQGFTVTDGGHTALALTKSSMEGYFGGSVIEVYSKNGKTRGSFETGGQINYIDTDGGRILVNTETGAEILNGRGETLKSVSFPRNPRECFLTEGGKKIFMIAGNKIEVMGL